MRILFLGTSEFAVPTLEALAASRTHEIIAVVTQPDRPQGRGLRVSMPPVKQTAERLGLPILQPKRVRAEPFLETAGEMKPDVLVLAAFGQIIPQALLDLPPFGPINVHGSLLPLYRGAAPIQYAILNGEKITGITTMWMDATLDTGDILLQREVPIGDDDTTGTLIPKMAAAGAELLIETLDRLAARNCPRIPQDHSKATFAPSITPADTEIDWNEPAGRIRNRIRALSPRPGAFAMMNGRKIKIWSAEVREDLPGQPGEVLAVTKQSVDVGAWQGALSLSEVQPENSRRMTAPEWARGARLAPGEKFD